MTQTTQPPSEEPSSQAFALLSENGIDARWLAEVLSGPDRDGHIESLVPSLVGTGQVGENVRCLLTWDKESEAEALPQSVVIKLASSNELSRAAAEATRTYVREVGFYRDVADTVAIRVPKAHHVWENQADNRFILVMEDISPAEAGDQLTGCSIERAELAIEAAADLHGSTWNRPGLVDLDWIDTPTPERSEERAGLFDLLYPAFVERFEDRLSAETLEFGSWLSGAFRSWSASMQDPPRCLIHGDFRLDNMLFGTGAPASPLTTVDWQTPGFGAGLSDVAYFLSGSLNRADLRAVEPRLLAQYRDRLAGHDVTRSEEECLTEYRLASPAGFVMAVVASQLVGQTERGDQMFLVMAEGSATQALDLDTRALVP